MIIDSGNLFYNFEYFFAKDEKKKREGVTAARAFNLFLLDTLTSPTISSDQREEKLLKWYSAPSALQYYPLGQEHLIPLHVVVGASLGQPGRHLGSATLAGYDLSFFEFYVIIHIILPCPYIIINSNYIYNSPTTDLFAINFPKPIYRSIRYFLFNFFHQIKIKYFIIIDIKRLF